MLVLQYLTVSAAAISTRHGVLCMTSTSSRLRGRSPQCDDRVDIQVMSQPQPTSMTVLLPIDPMQWTPQHVESWFTVHKNGKWSAFAPKFAALSGDELCDLTEKQLMRFVENDPCGAIIFNDLVKLRGQTPLQQPLMTQQPRLAPAAFPLQPEMAQPPRWESAVPLPGSQSR
jgi:hypothetical protein